MKLKLEINKELDIMIALNISAEEWFFIQLLVLLEEGDDESLYRYFTQAKKDSVPKAILGSLQEKNIISKSYHIPGEGESFDPKKISFSNEFYKKYFKSSGEMGMELLTAYPMFITSGNKSFPMKNIAKHFKSLEDFAFMYGKAIKFNKSTHNSIMQTLEWAKESGAIHFSLPEFVISRKWEDLEKMQSGEIPTSFIATFDTVQLL